MRVAARTTTPPTYAQAARGRPRMCRLREVTRLTAAGFQPLLDPGNACWISQQQYKRCRRDHGGHDGRQHVPEHGMTPPKESDRKTRIPYLAPRH
ncbi:hypothetical protein GCM10010468_10200 [Actinocorallia longicatena]|uniref:Uncharacterized protein n=1 Tax=Actinocorallia longicatena TaxID=111803 RepID=A0ABP6Q065_9ACTN